MNLILGVCGSIAAYKSIEITRNLVKTGHHVKVILTHGALKFIVPQVFTYVGAHKVYGPDDDFLGLNPNEEDGPIPHIELAKWCDRLVIAPLSANTLAHLASGNASNLLTSCFLVLGSKKAILYPAMNSNMLEHPITRRNVRILNELSNVFISSSDYGILACGDLGPGKLPEVENIVDLAPIIPTSPREGPLVLITTGATISPLDPVRFLTNPASGLTGYILAKKYIQKGHKVKIIAGYESIKKIDYLENIPGVEVTRVKTSKDMEEEVLKLFPKCQIYISAAAICDITFPISNKKIKKEELSSSLPITRSTDILREVLKIRKKEQKIIGFAAETSFEPSLFMKKWRKKPVDLLVGNVVNLKKGFQSEWGEYLLILNGDIIFQGKLSKNELALKLIDVTEIT